MGGKRRRPRERRDALGMRKELGVPVLRQGLLSPWDVGLSDFVYFSPPKQAVASSKPNFWTHSLQIHCNGPGLKTRTRSENQDSTIIYKYIFLVDLDG